MLWNQDWDKNQVKHDVLSIESLAAWLETKNPARRYDYEDCSGKCLYGQY